MKTATDIEQQSSKGEEKIYNVIVALTKSEPHCVEDSIKQVNYRITVTMSNKALSRVPTNKCQNAHIFASLTPLVANQPLGTSNRVFKTESSTEDGYRSTPQCKAKAILEHP